MCCLLLLRNSLKLVVCLLPASGESFDALFALKLPNLDGLPSETYGISKQFLALIHFYIACTIDPSATHRHSQIDLFDDNLALYTTWEEKEYRLEKLVAGLAQSLGPSVPGIVQKEASNV